MYVLRFCFLRRIDAFVLQGCKQLFFPSCSKSCCYRQTLKDNCLSLDELAITGASWCGICGRNLLTRIQFMRTALIGPGGSGCRNECSHSHPITWFGPCKQWSQRLGYCAPVICENPPVHPCLPASAKTKGRDDPRGLQWDVIDHTHRSLPCQRVF